MQIRTSGAILRQKVDDLAGDGYNSLMQVLYFGDDYNPICLEVEWTWEESPCFYEPEGKIELEEEPVSKTNIALSCYDPYVNLLVGR